MREENKLWEEPIAYFPHWTNAKSLLDLLVPNPAGRVTSSASFKTLPSATYWVSDDTGREETTSTPLPLLRVHSLPWERV
jgi:hypothetical protein